MQTNEFKKSVFGGLDSKSVFSYLDTLAKDLEGKLRTKDDDIRELKLKLHESQSNLASFQDEFETFKETTKRELESALNSTKKEFDDYKVFSQNSYSALEIKYNSLLSEYEKEMGRISGAILMAENAATEITEKANHKAGEILSEAEYKAEKLLLEAKTKTDAEKDRYKKAKADVSDFTYDIKKLLDKLGGEIKDKTEK